jgi:AcrR family transcriptional regulator
MTRIANGRTYRSQLRAEQAEETRTRILDATVRVMARGMTSVSIPAVAREAGVSVPTVYRHFATKPDLVAAVYPHSLQRAALTQPAAPRSIDELREGMRAYFEHVESYDDIARAAMASPASDETRQATMPYRLGVFRRVADSIEPKVAQADRDRIARLLVVLTASSSLRMWRDNLGSSVDEAVDDLNWLLNAAIAAASKRRTRR